MLGALMMDYHKFYCCFGGAFSYSLIVFAPLFPPILATAATSSCLHDLLLHLNVCDSGDWSPQTSGIPATSSNRPPPPAAFTAPASDGCSDKHR